jgi:hypothetical protein
MVFVVALGTIEQKIPALSIVTGSESVPFAVKVAVRVDVARPAVCVTRPA